MCFFRHKWNKWSEARVTDANDNGVRHIVQDRTCAICGRYQLKVCWDKS